MYGLVNWIVRNKRLELIPDLNQWDNKFMISWSDTSSGMEADNDVCLNALAQFIKTYGGPHGEEQWKYDGIDKINLNIWSAACTVWGGFPKLSVEGKPSIFARLNPA